MASGIGKPERASSQNRPAGVSAAGWAPHTSAPAAATRIISRSAEGCILFMHRDRDRRTAVGNFAVMGGLG
jgi:hypothetical protein